MTQKKHVYEAEVMALPPLRMVLGDIPSPDPDGSARPDRQNSKFKRELEAPVKRLIAHLEDEKK